MSEEKKDSTLTDMAEGATPVATPMMMPTKLDPKKLKPIDKTLLAPKEKDKPIIGTGNKLYDAAFEAIPTTIERLRQHSLELIRKGEEMRAEEAFEKDIEPSNPTENTTVKKEISKPIINDIDDDGIDFGPDDDDDDFEF